MIGEHAWCHSVANIRMGSPSDGEQSMRIRATRSGTMDRIKMQVRHDNGAGGYSQGDGGTWLVRLMPDDGSDRHLPDVDATPLAQFTIEDIHTRTSGYLVLDWDAPVELTDGVIYHVWVINIHPDKVNNWSSTNNLNVTENYNPSMMGFPEDDLDLAVLFRTNASNRTWHQNGKHFPTYQFLFTAGGMQSYGYIGAYNNSGKHDIDINNSARQSIDVFDGDTFTATAIMVMIRRYGNPPPLIVTIKEQNDDNIQVYSIDPSNITEEPGALLMHWCSTKIDYEFINGRSYYLELSVNEASAFEDRYDVYPLNNGEKSADWENGHTLLNGRAENFVDGEADWHPGWEFWSDPLPGGFLRQNTVLPIFCI